MPNHLKLRAIVGQFQGLYDSIEVRCEQMDDYRNEPLNVGHTFREVVLYETFNPPLNYTNPWPLKIWCVELRIVGAGQPVLYPGYNTWIQLRGTGFESITEAQGLVVKPTQGVGLR